jgi:signal peptidase I
MKRGAIKNFLKKFWNLLWKDDSLKGWAFSIIFFFVFIKFIFFPFLSLATGTVLPLAIVESCSMHHQGTVFSNFNSWWERHESKYTNLNVDEENFRGKFLSQFRRGFTKGDILFITGVRSEKINIGDVIIFNAGITNPIIHRVVDIKQEGEEYIFSTFGDNNDGQINSEKSISSDQIVGKARFRVIPYLGWGKLIFFEHLKDSRDQGICHER